MEKLSTIIVLSLVVCLGLVGCKKYDEPEYYEIGNSETAYLVGLDEAGGEKFDSAEALDKFKVATRRVEIPHRWNKTGRWFTTGEWIDTVKVIVVDRAPVTREWTADNSGTSDNDQAIWVESSDSIGFSTGFNCTAYIKEADASQFLYYYPAETVQGESSRLAQVMDDEIRNKIQEVAADFAAGYNLDDLREKKKDMISQVREEVIPFFKERGITITTIGMFGGLTYENKQIQESIDNVFIAQQEKNKESALLEAMTAKEERLRREGVAIANQAREEAIGQADAVKLKAQAEAASIELVNAALKDAQSNPLFIQVKSLEVESQRIQQWNGSVPNFIMGDTGGGFVPMIQLPDQK